MTVPSMHEAEISVSDDLVRALIARQCPRWAHASLRRIQAWGTDHVIYRLGEELSVRLPKIDWAAGQGLTESRWLPELSPRLPVTVPIPIFLGEAGLGYPYRWYVSPWLRGQNPQPGGVHLDTLARQLADVVLALRSVPTGGGPVARAGQRGGPLVAAAASTRVDAALLRDQTDVDALLAIWDDAALAPPWAGQVQWLHGDLMEGNLLVVDSTLTGVIDWGALAVGDPAVELMIAWSMFDAKSREIYRSALGFVDDAMWRRGRAWAVSAALQALPYYRDTNPDIVARSWRVVAEVLADASGEGSGSPRARPTVATAVQRVRRRRRP